jgi:hypothetical protein
MRDARSRGSVHGILNPLNIPRIIDVSIEINVRIDRPAFSDLAQIIPGFKSRRAAGKNRRGFIQRQRPRLIDLTY